MARVQIRNWRGREIIEEKNQAVAQSLYKGISHILNEANNIAPKDEGILIQTSDVDVDPVAGKASAFYVQKYAPRLHEHPEYNFQGGRQGKWLEKATLANMDVVRDMIAKEIRERLGG
jgi:hypothetical protein